MKQCRLFHYMQLLILVLHISEQFVQHRLNHIWLCGFGQCAGNTHRHAPVLSAVFLAVRQHESVNAAYLILRQRFVHLRQLLHILESLFITYHFKMVFQRLLVYGHTLQHQRCLLQSECIPFYGVAVVGVFHKKDHS